MKNNSFINTIQTLDCTLRDGGCLLESFYDDAQSPRFGINNIKQIAKKLSEAGMDILELGKISTSAHDKSDVSFFQSMEELSGVIPETRRAGQLFAAMFPGPDFPENMIPRHAPCYCDVARVILRYSELRKSLDFCKMLALKGYKVFMQPMVTMRYTDDDLRMVFSAANEIRAHAVYIVDSYGYMRPRDIMNLFAKYDASLDRPIRIGIHLHNNMNMAFGNALAMLELGISRPLYIDTTILGMGQGAGNLQTELFADHMNKCRGGKYNYGAILEACEIIEKLWGAPRWGYSVTHLLGAINNTAYKYAETFRYKYALNFVEIHKILSHIPEKHRHRYTPDSARELLELNGFSNRLKGAVA